VKILTVFGTRPEAIKTAPVIKGLQHYPGIQTLTCATGQHREMLDQVLKVFAITPDYDLDIMTRGQSLSDVTSRVLHGVAHVIKQEKPDRILVQGDTTTAMATSLAAFYNKIPVGHVEAGLRSGDIHRPWPEEINRRFVDHIADLLFAPTQGAKAALEREGLGNRRIVVTGNTVVDALLQAAHLIETNPELQGRLAKQFGYLDPSKRLLLVTGHRREAFGHGIRRICRALAILAKRSDIEVIYPVHLNENVRQPVNELLAGLPSIHLVEPVEYLPFCYLMSRCHLILTDSGGVQEEAPALGKPVLVLREVTERPEGVEAGVAELVGTDVDRIVRSATRLLDDSTTYQAMSGRKNPYGDGKAALRICHAIAGPLDCSSAVDGQEAAGASEFLA
jgi:UDP-N-acetylglucosamine 2-epimerase (non-hydrolysing)